MAGKHNVKVLAYGVLLGGFMSEEWLGKPQPRRRSETPTASLSKYLHWILEWGGGRGKAPGWALFQELLYTLANIGKRHNVGISSVAVRWVLGHEHVGGVIVGMRLGLTAMSHIADNAAVFSFSLSEDDMNDIAAVQRKGRKLNSVLGDCGDEYRKDS
jgi:aryl-alcohol dehydrogenase-like predicted oxidoreductase